MKKIKISSILPLFHSPNQTHPKDSKQQIRRRKKEKEKKKEGKRTDKIEGGRQRDNQLNVNNDQQSGVGLEGNVTHLVLLCFVLFFFFFLFFFFQKKLFVPADFYFPFEMADIRKYARHSPV